MSSDATRTAPPTITTGPPNDLGYRRLATSAAERPVVRDELGGIPPAAELVSLLAFVHLSDLHVTDAQSPARAEFLDRLGDEDSPFAAALGRVGTYRPQEALTHHVVEAMARAVRTALPAGGPASGAPFSFAISTGDNVDNCQANELTAYLALLDGGCEVYPDSGDVTAYEGVGAAAFYDERYWHPDGTPPGRPDDFPRSRRGFPAVPGLFDACRRPFVASGLGLPWYAVYGNHDALLVGTQPADGRLAELAVGDRKPTRLASHLDPLALLGGTQFAPSPNAWGMLDGPSRAVTADRARSPVGANEWIAAHLESPGSPQGHGFSAEAASEGRAYYAIDAGILRLVVLDTVNREGGWQGSIDPEQFAWLEHELVAGHSRFFGADGSIATTANADRLFVLFGHHSIETLTNPWTAGKAGRFLGSDLVGLLGRFPNVLAFFNGHTHEHAVRAYPSLRPDGSAGGFFEVTTASHIDWPQQARLVELALDRASGNIVIVTEVLDHGGLVDPREGDLGDPATLAGWSRELSANAWQGRIRAAEARGRGASGSRNCVLVVPAPFALAAGAADALVGRAPTPGAG